MFFSWRYESFVFTMRFCLSIVTAEGSSLGSGLHEKLPLEVGDGVFKRLVPALFHKSAQGTTQGCWKYLYWVWWYQIWTLVFMFHLLLQFLVNCIKLMFLLRVILVSFFKKYVYKDCIFFISLGCKVILNTCNMRKEDMKSFWLW